MNSTTSWPRLLPRWLAIVGLWLLLSAVFSSQLYWAGYVTPWSQAFAAEAMYWLSWGMLAPLVFWMCQRVHGQSWSVYAAALLLGAGLTAVLQPIIGYGIANVESLLGLCVRDCTPAPALFSDAFLKGAVRVAGVNLPVYAGVVLAWHAATYYRESRDRELKTLELASALQQAQLQALRSQLNPHFLFNALHSIAELVHTDPKLAEQLIVRLGELLRRVLQSSASQEVSLAEELDFIRGYLEVEQMRLGERLRVIWDIEPEALAVRVPSLILQPLVENAIQHGISATSRPGELTISAHRDGAYLELEVRDTGPGLAPGAPERSAGIGLSNTRIRLRSLYGERHAFALGADPGLIVTVRIPLTTS